MSHKIFHCAINNKPSLVFFDSGTANSYILESSALNTNRLTFFTPIKLRGVGGRDGPTVTEQTNVEIKFQVKDSWTEIFSIICGIVPDGTFPAELTLGRQAIHKLGVYYIRNSENIQLLAFDGKPTLCPLKQCTVWPSIEEFLQFPETDFRNQCFATLAHSLNFSLEPNENIKRDKLITLIKTKFAKLFDTTSLAGAISKATSFLHDIDIKDPEISIKCAPRRYSPAQERFIKEYIDASIKSNFIKKSNSTHASPAHIVGRTKPERFTVDYRKFNERTIKDSYPLPNVKDQIQKAAGHRYYIKFDLKSGFYHIGLTERAKQLSAFVVPSGHYEYLVVPFGLTNAPATFQRVVDEALLPVRDITSNLIDDVLTWGDSLDEACRNAVAVLQRFDMFGFRLNSRKCAWFVTVVKFLGHIVSRQGVSADPDKIKAILDRPPPSTVTEVRSFLNATNYFREYVDMFSKLAGPLYELTSLPGKKSTYYVVTFTFGVMEENTGCTD